MSELSKIGWHRGNPPEAGMYFVSFKNFDMHIYDWSGQMWVTGCDRRAIVAWHHIPEKFTGVFAEDESPPHDLSLTWVIKRDGRYLQENGANGDDPGLAHRFTSEAAARNYFRSNENHVAVPIVFRYGAWVEVDAPKPAPAPVNTPALTPSSAHNKINELAFKVGALTNRIESLETRNGQIQDRLARLESGIKVAS